NRHEQLAIRFKLIVETHFIERRTVSEYADIQHISPKHLFEVVSEAFERSPLQIILDICLLEAKVHFKSTDKAVSEISYYLHSYEQPHFTNFIKKRTGFTP